MNLFVIGQNEVTIFFSWTLCLPRTRIRLVTDRLFCWIKWRWLYSTEYRSQESPPPPNSMSNNALLEPGTSAIACEAGSLRRCPPWDVWGTSMATTWIHSAFCVPHLSGGSSSPLLYIYIKTLHFKVGCLLLLCLLFRLPLCILARFYWESSLRFRHYMDEISAPLQFANADHLTLSLTL